MDKAAFTKLVVKIFLFYQSAKMPNDNQISLWFDQISHIPNEAIDFIEKEIYKERDSLPRNIPKSIREAYELSPKEKRFYNYDQVEDLRFPVAKMMEGLEILQKKGMEAFLKFAKFVQMPQNDRDRVIMKHSVISGENSLDINMIKKSLIFKDKKMDVNERIVFLKHQVETLLIQPGEEIDEIPF